MVLAFGVSGGGLCLEFAANAIFDICYLNFGLLWKLVCLVLGVILVLLLIVLD